MDAQELDRLAVAAASGDRTAFRDLFLATQQELRLTIAAHGVSAEQVEETLQATYLAAFEKLSQYRPGGTLTPWLKAIARHLLIDRWREQRRMASLDSAPLDELVAAAAIDQLEDEEETRVAEARSARLAVCLGQLPEHARTLIERRYRDDLPLNDLARRFKRTAAALSVALHRIRAGLRRCLEQA